MDQSETWDGCALDYENTIEKVTSPCVVRLLEELALLPVPAAAAPIKAIDLAAGPGILATLLGEAYSQAGQLNKLTILSTDFSSNMMELAQRQFNAHDWSPTQFAVRTLDATNLLDVPADCYTHAFCTFGLLMMPNAPKAVQEMFRVLQPAGTIGITTWHKMGWLPIVSECLARAKRLGNQGEATALAKSIPSDWSDRAFVQKTLEEAGFQQVQVNLYESCSPFVDQHEFVQKFTQARWIQPILQKAELSEEQRQRYNQVVPDVLRELVGPNPDQPFNLPMIAVIARGLKPT